MPAELLFRRVTVRLDVLLAGVTIAPGDAEAEAFGRLERAVRMAGGLVNLHAVTSAVGRYRPPVTLAEEIKARGVR